MAFGCAIEQVRASRTRLEKAKKIWNSGCSSIQIQIQAPDPVIDPVIDPDEYRGWQCRCRN